MRCTIQEQYESISAELTALIEKQQQLELTCEVVLQSNRCLMISALAAERGRRGPLTREDESSIRSSVKAIDKNYLDSLEIDLETVNKQIALLTPGAPIQH